MGRVTKFLTDDLTNQVSHVVVKFNGLPEEVAIAKYKGDWKFTTGIIATRTQFPLTLAYGITIHKSQSLTVSHLMLDTNNGVFQLGMVYVGCSHVQNLKNLHFIDFTPEAVECDKSCIKEINQQRNISLNNTLPKLNDDRLRPIRRFKKIPPIYQAKKLKRSRICQIR